MDAWRNGLRFILQIGIAMATLGILDTQAVHAQGYVPSIALKSGESSELSDIWWVSNCRSLLKGTPEAEILDGPNEVTLEVKEAMVLPRNSECAKRVPGGKLVIKAKEIEEPSYTRLTIRIRLKGQDGNREISQVFNLRLLP
jgi:hypothetical protein